jgi:hypothetical protein
MCVFCHVVDGCIFTAYSIENAGLLEIMAAVCDDCTLITLMDIFILRNILKRLSILCIETEFIGF